MSLIHTYELAGVNPFEYMTELQKHAGDLHKDPAAQLPWNYLEALAEVKTPPYLTRTSSFPVKIDARADDLRILTGNSQQSRDNIAFGQK